MRRLNKVNGKILSLTAEEASVILAFDMGLQITSYMESLLAKIEKKAQILEVNYRLIVATAALTDGVKPGVIFNNKEEFKNSKTLLENP